MRDKNGLSVSKANGPSVSVTNGLSVSKANGLTTLTKQLVNRLFGSLAYDNQAIHHHVAHLMS